LIVAQTFSTGGFSYVTSAVCCGKFVLIYAIKGFLTASAPASAQQVQVVVYLAPSFRGYIRLSTVY